MTWYFRLLDFSFVHCADVTCQQHQQVNNSSWSMCMWLTLYTDTHQHLQNQQLSWDGGDWKCNTDNSCPSVSLSADWTGCMLLIKGYSYCMSQDRQLMQIHKLVLGPKFGAHMVDQGLNTVFMSTRASCSQQKTSCMVLIDKVKHFNFCCIICEFLSFY